MRIHARPGPRIYLTGNVVSRERSSSDANYKDALDAALVRLDSAGRELWSRTFDGGEALVDVVNDSAVGVDGSVTVVGFTKTAALDIDQFVVRYGPDGTERWVRQFDGGAGENDGAGAVILDDAGAAYVTGSARVPAGTRFQGKAVTMKYDPEGRRVWTAFHEDRRERPNAGVCIGIHGAHLYVGGVLGRWGSTDFLVLKYDLDGREIWAREYDGCYGGPDRVVALAIDERGNIFVTGESGRGLQMGIADYLTLMYTPSGELVWSACYDGPARGLDRPVDIVAGAGSVTVTGISEGIWFPSPSGTRERSDENDDWATVRYSLAGEELWVARYDHAGWKDQPRAIIRDGRGGVIVTGYLQATSAWRESVDVLTIAYDADGKRTWMARYGGEAEGADIGIDLALDGGGNVYVAGIEQVSDPAGDTFDLDLVTLKYKTSFVPPAPNERAFIRGDCDGDLETGLTDAVFLLGSRFLGEQAPPCLAACDIDGDGSVGITDAVYLLRFHFLDGPPPPLPFPRCGAGRLANDAALGCDGTRCR